ncbi:MAG TPA: FtsQ-type POTRA domain-containing protein [Actinopolymorphaceae bacterium]|jgi:cell division protein FtsQ|nr:FtsQ-type POTRA domain-containing protein [Actinopolymorphaceae bacterium]
MTVRPSGRPGARPGSRPGTRTIARTPGVSPSSAKRFARRQFTRRLARLGPVFVLAGVVVLAGFVAWLVAFSTVLDVRTVAVSGLTPESGLSAVDVRTAAAVPLGGPLARVDLAAARARVLAELAPVREAKVTRSWPHGVQVEVAERSAVAVWRDGQTRRLVDIEGVPFRTAAGFRRAVPLVDVRATGKGVGKLPELRAAGARVAAALPAKLAGRVSSVEVQTLDSVVLRLDRGVTVMWGSADDSPAKARVLSALLRHRAKVYDVSVPGFPTTKA